MHPLLARIPLLRRPFFQLEVARRERHQALAERDAAVEERDGLKAQLRAAENARTAQPPTQRTCVFCRNEVAAWLPFEVRARDMSPFLIHLETVGSDVERFWCPHCRSTDRERHLYLYFDRLRIAVAIRGGSVLHLAPEASLGAYLRDSGLSHYVKGDLSPFDGSVRRLDVHDLPFAAGTFDLAICNHVLEHVANPALALAELHRVLKPGARLVCQTPFATRLTHAFEDPLLQSMADRLFFYGQEDHVRLFGADVADLFRQAGFTGRLIPHAELLPEIEPEQFGICEREPFFDFVKAS